jgi:hypothetical protein
MYSSEMHNLHALPNSAVFNTKKDRIGNNQIYKNHEKKERKPYTGSVCRDTGVLR